MLSEIDLDVLRFFDRTELEGLQMHSRYLRDFVNRHACNLPLRYIHRVDFAHGGVVVRRAEQQRSSILAADEQCLEGLFHRVNNAFIYRMRLSFRPEDLPVPQYLRANAGKVHCQIGVLVIDGNEHEDSPAPAIDYTLVGFMGVHLDPQTCETWMSADREDYALLFAHNALRGNITHLGYRLNETPTPDCIIPKLFGDGAVQTCAIATDVDPRPWIAKFVETFETTEQGVDAVRSVALLYERPGDASTLRLTVAPFGQPNRTGVPTPHSAFIKELYRSGQSLYHSPISTTESPFAELYVFENARSAKKLEVFVWTVEEVENEAQTSLHYAFLLQVADV